MLLQSVQASESLDLVLLGQRFEPYAGVRGRQDRFGFANVGQPLLGNGLASSRAAESASACCGSMCTRRETDRPALAAACRINS